MSDAPVQNGRFDSAFRRFVTDPVNIALGILLAVLTYLILWPFFQLILETLTWGDSDRRLSREAVPGAFTWFHWLQATASPIAVKMLYGPLMNTLLTGAVSTVMALSAGGRFGVVRGAVGYAGKTLAAANLNAALYHPFFCNSAGVGNRVSQP